MRKDSAFVHVINDVVTGREYGERPRRTGLCSRTISSTCPGGRLLRVTQVPAMA